MDVFFHLLAKSMMALFAVGVAGCIVTIPVVAWKFFSVLFEKDEPKHAGEVPIEPQA